jgi:hypothetical protein
MRIVSNVGKFFDTALEDLSCDPKTRAYVVSVFTKFAKTSYDLPSNSITLTFHEAKRKQDFATYQALGDWILFCQVEFPEYLRNASNDYYLTIGRLSYYSCYRLINRQWLLFDELAENLDGISNEARVLLSARDLKS